MMRIQKQGVGVLWAVIAMCVLLCALGFGIARAQESADAANDVALPSDEAAIATGKTRFAEKCSGFCHGAGGKGGRGPCLICGKFKSGGKNSQIIANITNGIDKTPMGAFGGVLSSEEILSVVAYLRGEQKKKEEAAQ